MAFTPILNDRSIDSIRNNTNYRNNAREVNAGAPVFFTPSYYADGVSGFGGPKYLSPPPYYNYDNSPSTWLGNCTWWCCGRLQEALGKRIMDYIGNTAWHAKYWYENFTGDKDTNADNAQAGDIIVLTNSGEGHVAFIEKVEAGIIYISESAYSQRSEWVDKACLVTTYPQSSIYAGASIDMYKDIGPSFYSTVVGVIHTGEGSEPQPTTPLIPILARFLLNRGKRGRINVRLFK